MLSKLSGWYRVLIVSSICWVIVALINIDPWTRYSSGLSSSLDGGGAYNHWDKFLTFGIMPIVLLWGIIWIAQGFRKKQDETKPQIKVDCKEKEIETLSPSLMDRYSNILTPSDRQRIIENEWSKSSELELKKQNLKADSKIKNPLGLISNEKGGGISSDGNRPQKPSKMYSLNGCGTTLYGKQLLSDEQILRFGLDPIQKQRLYIATEWIVISFLPILPLRSWIIILEWDEHSGILSSNKQYQMVKTKLNRKQVLHGWSITIGVSALIIFFILSR